MFGLLRLKPSGDESFVAQAVIPGRNDLRSASVRARYDTSFIGLLIRKVDLNRPQSQTKPDRRKLPRPHSRRELRKTLAT